MISKTFIQSRTFRIIDDDNSKCLDAKEFAKACDDFGVTMSADEKRQLFEIFDKDHGGTIDFEEFLEKLRVYPFDI